jgi:transcriptional regulator with XRE-family HTH domain
VNASRLLASVRDRARLSTRELARRGATSHPTLVAYEHGRVVPGVDTLDRLVRAAGFDLTAEATRRVGTGDPARGRELVEVLELAAMFPARHDEALSFPIFGR